VEAYLPMVVFGLWGAYQAWRFGDWLSDPRYVREPQRRWWSPWRMMNPETWTDEGRVMRNKFLRSMGVGILLAVAAIVVSKALQAQ
jgi:hypothetical protein